MIARGDSIGGSALNDTGARLRVTEWGGPPMPAPAARPKQGRRRRSFIARR